MTYISSTPNAFIEDTWNVFVNGKDVGFVIDRQDGTGFEAYSFVPSVFSSEHVGRFPSKVEAVDAVAERYNERLKRQASMIRTAFDIAMALEHRES